MEFKIKHKKVLLGVTGSVAAIKVPELVKSLYEHHCEVRIVFTNRGATFITPEQHADLLSTGVTTYSDDSEWLAWSKKGDPVLHIELRKWCDVFVVCPLDANTLAKLANGLCDNLLTSVVRAWANDKPVIVCPAMNSAMWRNPFTAKHLHTLQEVYSVHIVPPRDDYLLACGDVGPGALANVESIVRAIVE